MVVRARTRSRCPAGAGALSQGLCVCRRVRAGPATYALRLSISSRAQPGSGPDFGGANSAPFLADFRERLQARGNRCPKPAVFLLAGPWRECPRSECLGLSELAVIAMAP